MSIHNDSITKGLKNITGQTVSAFEIKYGGSGMTTKMKICSTCFNSYFSAKALQQLAVQFKMPQQASSSSCALQEETSGVQSPNQSTSSVSSSEIASISTSLSLSQISSSSDSRIQPVPLTEVPSYEREDLANERYAKLKEIAKILNITLPSIGTLKPYKDSYRSAAEDSTRREVLNAIDKLFLSEHTVYEDQTIIVENIKAALADEQLTSQEKFRLIRLVPSYWSASKTGAALDISPYTVYQAKKPSQEITKRPVGNKPLSEEVKKKVIEFYLSSETSRIFPGKKDKVSLKQPNGKRENIQKQLLLYNLVDLHKMFGKKYPEFAIGLTSFKSLRPKQCVFSTDSAAHNVCVCVYHQNVKFCVEALHEMTPFKEYETSTALLHELMKRAMCDDPTEACKLQTCEDCDSTRMIDYIATNLDAVDTIEVKHKMWITSPRYNLIEVSVEVDTFLEYLKTQIENFIVHDFKVCQQQEFVESTKNELVPNKEVLIHCDFAENYTCIEQDAPQGAYFNAPQVTVHTACIYYRTDVGDLKVINSIIVSPIVKHDSSMVRAVQDKLVQLVKNLLPDLKLIKYLSDGCAGQYKNKVNLKNVCLHEKDYSVKAQWHFFPTSHGKGPVDGIGATIKRTATTASIRQTANIYSAEEMYSWAQGLKSSTTSWQNFEFEIITKKDLDTAEKHIDKITPSLVPIKGTMSYHGFIPVDNDTIKAYEFSKQATPKVVSLHRKPAITNNKYSNETDCQLNLRKKPRCN